MKRLMVFVGILLVYLMAFSFEMYDENSVLSLYLGMEAFTGVDRTGDINEFKGYELQGKLKWLRFGVAADSFGIDSVKSWRVSWEQNFGNFSLFASYKYVEFIENRYTLGGLFNMSNFYFGLGGAWDPISGPGVFGLGRFEIGPVGLDSSVYWDVFNEDKSFIYGLAADAHFHGFALRFSWYSNNNWYVNLGYAMDPVVRYDVDINDKDLIEGEKVVVRLKKTGMGILEPSGNNYVIVKAVGKKHEIVIGKVYIREKSKELGAILPADEYKIVLEPSARFSVGYGYGALGKAATFKVHEKPSVYIEVPKKVYRNQDTEIKFSVSARDLNENYYVEVYDNDSVVYSNTLKPGSYRVKLDTSRIGPKKIEVNIYGRHFANAETVVKARYRVEYKKPKFFDIGNLVENPIKLKIMEDVNGRWVLAKGVKFHYIVKIQDIRDMKVIEKIEGDGFTDEQGNAVLAFMPKSKVGFVNMEVSFSGGEYVEIERRGLDAGNKPNEVYIPVFLMSNMPYKLVYKLEGESKFIEVGRGKTQGKIIYIYKTPVKIPLMIALIDRDGNIVVTGDELKIKAISYDPETGHEMKVRVKTKGKISLNSADFSSAYVEFDDITQNDVYVIFYLQNKKGETYFVDFIVLRYVGSIGFDREYTLNESDIKFGEPSHIKVKVTMAGYIPLEGVFVTAQLFVNDENGNPYIYNLNGVTNRDGILDFLTPEIRQKQLHVRLMAEIGGGIKSREVNMLTMDATLNVHDPEVVVALPDGVTVNGEDKIKGRLSDKVSGYLEYFGKKIIRLDGVYLSDLRKALRELPLPQRNEVSSGVRINSNVDFVPYYTGNKRGLETIVPFKTLYSEVIVGKRDLRDVILIPTEPGYLPISGDSLNGKTKVTFEKGARYTFKVELGAFTIGEPPIMNPARYSIYLKLGNKELYLGSTYKSIPAYITLPKIPIDFIRSGIRVYRNGYEIPGQIQINVEKKEVVWKINPFIDVKNRRIKIEVPEEFKGSRIFASSVNTFFGIPMPTKLLLNNMIMYGSGTYDLVVYNRALRVYKEYKNMFLDSSMGISLEGELVPVKITFEHILKGTVGTYEIYVDDSLVKKEVLRKGADIVSTEFLVTPGIHELIVNIPGVINSVRTIIRFKKNSSFNIKITDEIKGHPSTDSSGAFMYPSRVYVFQKGGKSEYVFKASYSWKIMYLKVPYDGVLSVIDYNVGLKKDENLVKNNVIKLSSMSSIGTQHVMEVRKGLYELKYYPIFATKIVVYHVPGYLPIVIPMSMERAYSYLDLATIPLKSVRSVDMVDKLFRVELPKSGREGEEANKGVMVKIIGISKDGKYLMPIRLPRGVRPKNSIPSDYDLVKFYKKFTYIKHDRWYYSVVLGEDEEMSGVGPKVFSSLFELGVGGIYHIEFVNVTAEKLTVDTNNLEKYASNRDFYLIEREYLIGK